MEPVERPCHNAHGSIEAEGEVGPRKVVVYGLGHAYGLYALVVELGGDAQGVVPAYAYEGVYLELLDVPEELLRVLRLLQRICAGCAEYRPSERQKAGDRPPVELDCLRLDEPPPAFPYAGELVPELKSPFDNGPYDSVKPRAISSAGQYPDIHPLPLHLIGC